MHPVAFTLSRNALMMVQGRSSSSSSRITVLVLSRGMSRTSNKNLRLSSTSKPSLSPKKQQQPIHSSAKTEQSTPTLSMEEQGGERIAESVASSLKAITPPTTQQLKVLFTASSIPMIGFGFMDNLVMIQAGQFIDNTIGVTMGLATMTAAAAGQVVSDVSGVVFGGSLERFLHRYKLIQSSTLTAAQRALPLCRNVALLGAVCGVALGCGLGASCLLFMDLAAKERAERAIQLQAVLNDMMMDASSSASPSSEDEEDETPGSLHSCESCTIHLLHDPAAKQHFSTKYNNNEGKTKIDILPKTTATTEAQPGGEKLSLAVQAAEGAKSVMNNSGSVLCTPVLSGEGEVVAVLEFHSKKDSAQGFSMEDEKAAKVMARHIGIFMHRLSD